MKWVIVLVSFPLAAVTKIMAQSKLSTRMASRKQCRQIWNIKIRSQNLIRISILVLPRVLPISPTMKVKKAKLVKSSQMAKLMLISKAESPKDPQPCPVEPSTKASGKMICVTVLANKSGLMVPNMKEIGLMIKLTDKASYTMQTVIFMKAPGKMIKQMGMEFTLMQMEPDIQVLGKTINNMDSEKKRGQMEQFMKVSILTAKRMEKES